jgi:hypothetical protein
VASKYVMWVSIVIFAFECHIHTLLLNLFFFSFFSLFFKQPSLCFCFNIEGSGLCDF